jgi:hypothetical protein
MIAEKGRNSPCYVLDEYPAKNPMERLGLGCLHQEVLWTFKR